MGSIIALNGGAIALGGLLGPLLKRHIPTAFLPHVMFYFAAITAAIGVSLLGKGGSLTVGVLAILSGAFVGEALHLDDRMGRFLSRFQSGNGSEDQKELLVTGFVLMVCSTSGLLGAMTARLGHDNSILLTKALMDFCCSLCFSLSAGRVLALLSIPTVALLCGVYALSASLSVLLSEQMLVDFFACGGLLQLVNAIKLVRGKEVPILNLLPALIFVFPISALAGAL